MSSTHQLAAIMFADIAGYTELMQQDEDLALKKIHQFKKELKSRIHEPSGEIIQYYGDGCLAIFTSSADAVSCAAAIQKDFQLIHDIPVRIGLHLGDILKEGGNIFGDSVNITARITGMGIPGSVLFSGSIREQLRNKPEFKCSSLGEFEFKNVKTPMEVFALANTGFPVPSLVDIKGKFKETSSEKSIAVLPFVNMSNDPDQEYFGDGIAEEIINSLSHISQLRVAGRTSSFHFKNKNPDLRLVGKNLKVKSILEGSVRKQNNKIRITAQLINVEDGFHLWSERFDCEADDIFSIQDEIALAITEKLKITLLTNEKEQVLKKPTQNQEAYDIYLKGRFYLNKRGDGIKKGLQYFQQAIKTDPGFALAYSGMADAYSILGFYGILPPYQAMPMARTNAEKAVQLDPKNAAGFTNLGFIYMFYDWNWPAAKNELQHAMETNPTYEPALYWYSYYLSFIEGKFEESISIAKKAAEQLEPFVSLSHHVLSIVLINAGRFEEALHASQMAVELDPQSFLGYRGLGLSFTGQKKYSNAIEAIQKAIQLSNRNPMLLSELCWVYSITGQENEAGKILEELIARSEKEYISGLCLSAAAYYCKKTDAALQYLDKAFEQRDETLPCINVYPPAAFIRQDKQFSDYIRKMKFPVR
jgi:TolB-like protein/lipoprotein NlpI